MQKLLVATNSGKDFTTIGGLTASIAVEYQTAKFIMELPLTAIQEAELAGSR